MNVTAVERQDFFGMPAWRVSSPSGATALVAERGATVLSWQPRPGDEVIDGYVSGEELDGHIGNRSLIMAPWCGRVAGGAYSFGGRSHRLPGGAELSGLGGRVTGLDFARVGTGDPLVLKGSLQGDDGYPWDLEITVIVALEAGSDEQENLSVTIDVRNDSDAPAPVTL